MTANNRLSTPGSPGQQADGDCALTVKGVFLYYVSRNFSAGGMAERLIAAVLKTVEGHTSGGSNPSPSARRAKYVPAVRTDCGDLLFKPGRG